VSSWRFAITAEATDSSEAQRYLFAVESEDAFREWVEQIKKQIAVNGGKHYAVKLTGANAKRNSVVKQTSEQLKHLQAQNDLSQTDAVAAAPTSESASTTETSALPEANPATAEDAMLADESAQVRAETPKALIGKRVDVEGYGRGVVTGMTTKTFG
jgi:hypothetical protein